MNAATMPGVINGNVIFWNVRTFPRQVFDSAKVTIPPQVHVLATMIMLVSIAIIVGGTIAGNRRAAKGL